MEAAAKVYLSEEKVLLESESQDLGQLGEDCGGRREGWFRHGSNQVLKNVHQEGV